MVSIPTPSAVAIGNWTTAISFWSQASLHASQTLDRSAYLVR
jgi:hypothetical protein